MASGVARKSQSSGVCVVVCVGKEKGERRESRNVDDFSMPSAVGQQTQTASCSLLHLIHGMGCLAV